MDEISSPEPFNRDDNRYYSPYPTAFSRSQPSARRSFKWKRNVLANAFSSNLEEIDVLGSNVSGHTGCVNALSWAHDGNLLLSGGDDTTVRIWRLASGGSKSSPFPFTCQSVIETGHTANIFNAHILPHSTKIATVAGDRQVRVFDAAAAISVGNDGSETRYRASNCDLRVLRCHTGRTKRIVTEESPDLFLTVAEDGTVRQHDLRSPHRCRSQCPAPLVKLNSELSTLSLSPLTPYQFVVAGESPYGFLFDRRHAGRFIEEEWGIPISDKSTTCVRMFGRRQRSPGERRGYEHITGSRMSSANGHEVLLSYSSDAVYLYSTHDDAEVLSGRSEVGVLAPNARSLSQGEGSGNSSPMSGEWVIDMESFPSEMMAVDDGDEDEGEDGDESEERSEGDHRERMHVEESSDYSSDEVEELEDYRRGMEGYEDVPVVFPRRRFSGHCNIETVKDVNFLGPSDEYVVSGSDDGNWFMWRKSSGSLCGIYRGDESVVNVIESHPSLPLVAVSGIDYTVKLFAPVHYKSSASRLSNAEVVIERNTKRATSRRINLHDLIMQYHLSTRRSGDGEGGSEEAQCAFQ